MRLPPDDDPYAPECVLADDQTATLDAVARVLRARGFRIAAAVRDGQEALGELAAHPSAIGIVNARLPRVSGLEIARRAAPGTAIILYTGHRDRASLLDGLAAGVRGIVLKEAPLEDLVRAIQTVATGGVYIDPVLAGVIVTAEGTKALTDRERSVLRLLADGHRNDLIAEELGIAPDTVRAHVRNAMRKLGVDTRTQAVAEALRRALIE